MPASGPSRNSCTRHAGCSHRSVTQSTVKARESPDRSRPRPRRSGHPHPSGMITVKPADGAVPPPPVLQSPGQRDDAGDNLPGWRAPAVTISSSGR
jgi:hypothetical protein